MLVLRGADGTERSYAVSAPVIAAASPRRRRHPAASRFRDGGRRCCWPLLGGAILNLMPCVFPILSLKLLGLAVSVHRAEERRHGLAYAAGVILSFAALGGLLLALRAGGAAIGWGFQLQSPVVVALLAYLLFAMGLSLSGVAEFGVGLGGIGGRFAERAGLAGAFATGVLATVVATPCTAPFMGTALGFAMLAPPADGACRLCRARRRSRRAGRAGDRGSRHRAPAAAARAVDAVVQAAAGVSALRDRRLADLGADAAGRAGRRVSRACSAWCWSGSRCGSTAAPASPSRPDGGSGSALAATGLAAALAVAATLAPATAPAASGSRRSRRPRLRELRRRPGSTGSSPSTSRSLSI